MKCDDCKVECEMHCPMKYDLSGNLLEDVTRKFTCPKCRTTFVAVDLFTDEDYELN